MTRVSDISTINDLALYLEELRELRSRYLIAIAVKDTPGFHLTPEISARFRALGLVTDLHDKHGNGYVALIADGDVVGEELSGPRGTSVFKGDVDSARVELRSSIYTKENIARIVVNGRDYAVNSRGVNIVVYDTQLLKLIDSVCFDTHLPAYPFFRLEDRRNIQLQALERQISDVRKGMQKITKELERMRDQRAVDTARTEMMLWHSMPTDEHHVHDARRAFFRSLPPATGVLRKLQLAGLILLLEFDRVAKENDIEYWLCFGNLLGAVRNDEFIPWDDDTDICITRDQLPKIRKAFEGNENFYLDEFYSVRDTGHTNMNCIYQIHFQERNTPYSLDLFVMDYSEKLDRHLIERTREIHQQMSERAREVCGKLHGSKPLRERHTDPAYLEVFQQHHTIIAPEYGSEKNYVVWGIDNVPSWTGMNTFFPCEWVYPLGEVELAGHRFSAPREPEKVVTRIYGEPWSVPDDMFSHRHFNIDETRERILDGILEKYRDWLGDLWDSETL